MESNAQQTQEVLKQETEILKEEKAILQEVKKEQRSLKSLTKNVWFLNIAVVVIVVGVVVGLLYWNVSSNRVYTDKASIMAPEIALAPKSSGTLEELYVHEGDAILKDTTVARVGNELIKTSVDTIVVSVKDDVGKIFNPGEAVVTVIDPSTLRVVGSVGEDKGLTDIRVGQRAVFTVDAFGGRQFDGIVDEVSPTSHQSDIVFNISDKRETQDFDVKVRFDINAYPELKNGMSAKIWVYKN